MLSPKLNLLAMAALITALVSGCGANTPARQSSKSDGRASELATVTLNPDLGQTVIRGPYTFTLNSAYVKPPDGEPYDLTEEHRPGDRVIRAAVGHRFVVVRIAMYGKGADPLRLYWNAGPPHLVADGQSYLLTSGSDGGDGDGLFLLSDIFEIPEGARSITFVMPVRAAGGDVTFRLR